MAGSGSSWKRCSGHLEIQRMGDLLMAAHARASCPAIASSGARNRIEICRLVPFWRWAAHAEGSLLTCERANA